MLQSVSLSALQPAAANPRRKIDRKALEGLPPASGPIEVLHNLVVSPVGNALVARPRASRSGPGRDQGRLALSRDQFWASWSVPSRNPIDFDRKNGQWMSHNSPVSCSRATLEPLLRVTSYRSKLSR